MPYRILHHTWSMRTVSAFVVPLPISRVDRSTLDTVATEMTAFLRICVRPDEERDVLSQDDGTYVLLDWIVWDEPKKTNNNNADDSSIFRRHLHVQVTIADQPKAYVVLCNPQLSSENAVTYCSYALVRGARHALDTVVQWLESNCGCVFETFQPRPNQVAHAMSQWTYQQVFHKTASVDNTNKTTQKATKVLEVTFSLPVPDLSQATLTIPPVALARMCREMEAQRPTQKACGPSQNEEELPILRALRNYVQEAYHVNLANCPLIRASSAVAVLGCDGRVKPLDESSLTLVLDEIESMMRQRQQQGRPRHMADDNDDDASAASGDSQSY